MCLPFNTLKYLLTTEFGQGIGYKEMKESIKECLGRVTPHPAFNIFMFSHEV